MKPKKNTTQKKEYKTAWLKEIVIDEALNYVDEEGNPIGILGNLSPINVFVGPTSTGKTRLMRTICSMSDPEVKWGGEISDKFDHEIAGLCEKHKNIVRKKPFDLSIQDLLSTLAGSPFIDNFNKIVSYLTEHQKASWHVSTASILGGKNPDPFDIYTSNLKSQIQQLEWKQKKSDQEIPPQIIEVKEFIANLDSVQEKFREQSKAIEYFTGYGNGTNKGERFFISSTRINLPNLYCKDRTKEGLIEKAIRQQFFAPEENDQNIKIWTGERTFAELKHFQKSESFDEYVKYLRNWVFNTKDLRLKVTDDTIQVSLDNEPFRCISEHGDGVMNLITLTLPFYTEAPRILFFDEPEHGLHPGHLQAFVKELINYRQGVDNGHKHERSVIVFITTHSGELLDMLNTVEHKSFFKFKRVPKDEIQIKQISWGDSELVKELGIRPGASMLVNCTIWVEGVTDRKVYSHLVSQYMKKENLPYRESIHYAFAEYGGANIKHWSFIDDTTSIDLATLCGPHMIVLDDDGVNIDDDTEKAKYRKKLKKKLQDRAIYTPGRELDNLYPEKHVKKKAKEWGCYKDGVKKIKVNDYLKSEVKLGEYLKNIGVTYKIGTNSGHLTTGYKNKITEGIDFLQWDDWDKDVQEMITKMVDFIEEMNK